MSNNKLPANSWIADLFRLNRDGFADGKEFASQSDLSTTDALTHCGFDTEYLYKYVEHELIYWRDFARGYQRGD